MGHEVLKNYTEVKAVTVNLKLYIKSGLMPDFKNE